MKLGSIHSRSMQLLAFLLMFSFAAMLSQARQPGEKPIAWLKIRVANSPAVPVYASEVRLDTLPVTRQSTPQWGDTKPGTNEHPIGWLRIKAANSPIQPVYAGDIQSPTMAAPTEYQQLDNRKPGTGEKPIGWFRIKAANSPFRQVYASDLK
jgi:hypothetical protein